jgi:hypothetical protein
VANLLACYASLTIYLDEGKPLFFLYFSFDFQRAFGKMVQDSLLEALELLVLLATEHYFCTVQLLLSRTHTTSRH